MKAFVADTSALVRMMNGQAHAAWTGFRDAGLIAVCPPVEYELGRTAQSWRDHKELQTYLRGAFTWLPVADRAWSDLLELQQELVRIGHHRGPSLIDLLIAHTAAHHDVAVLHADNDFDTIAKVLPIERARVEEGPPA